MIYLIFWIIAWVGTMIGYSTASIDPVSATEFAALFFLWPGIWIVYIWGMIASISWVMGHWGEK